MTVLIDSKRKARISAARLIRDGRGNRQQRRALQRGRAGFTILEVMLAMAVLVIGMTSVLTLFTFGAALARTAEMRSASAGAVEAVVADLEESLFPLDENGKVGEPVPIVDRPVPGVATAVYSAIPTVNPDDPIEYRVDVELAWTTKGVRRARTFSVLLLREVPFDERLRRRFVRKGN
ncbi:MAG: prepilin-type N-terminal cleavage/methylation domain-containing protein [Planctomycetota bacterium]|jgi:prepilin-type N-terminal cleavage/methylation domain-containing protein